MAEKLIVAKFGGSSLASAAQFQKVKNLILEDKDRRFVVPSAPGKRSKEDVKVTDLLYTCYHNVNDKKCFETTFRLIKERYEEIINELSLSISLEKEFDEIRSSFINRVGEMYAASRGEYLNGILLAAYLGYTFVDSKDVIRFTVDNELDPNTTNILLYEKLKDLENAVIPGFYGSDETGKIHTFSRGGSDVTGALVARAIKATTYENWTDVSGFLVADPSIVENPKQVQMMTFAELRELSYRGATVLHEDAVYPARREGISIHIKNTNKPEDFGTLIKKEIDPKLIMPITGIAGKRNFVAISIAKSGMTNRTAYHRKLLDIIDKFKISSEHMPSGIDTLGIIIPSDQYEKNKDEILLEIQESIMPDSIQIDEDMAMVTVVGKGMRAVSGIAANFFTALGKAHVNIKLIDMGSNEMNCAIGVSNKDFEGAIRALYDALVLNKL